MIKGSDRIIEDFIVQCGQFQPDHRRIGTLVEQPFVEAQSQCRFPFSAAAFSTDHQRMSAHIGTFPASGSKKETAYGEKEGDQTVEDSKSGDSGAFKAHDPAAEFQRTAPGGQKFLFFFCGKAPFRPHEPGPDFTGFLTAGISRCNGTEIEFRSGVLYLTERFIKGDRGKQFGQTGIAGLFASLPEQQFPAFGIFTGGNGVFKKQRMQRAHTQTGELRQQGIEFGFFGDGAIEIQFDLLKDRRQSSKKTELLFISHFCLTPAAFAVHDQHPVARAGPEDPENVFSLPGFRSKKFTGRPDVCMKDTFHMPILTFETIISYNIM
jgi:hypothetical protein